MYVWIPFLANWVLGNLCGECCQLEGSPGVQQHLILRVVQLPCPGSRAPSLMTLPTAPSALPFSGKQGEQV